MDLPPWCFSRSQPLDRTCRDSTTLAVGCYDLAQFVSHIPHGAARALVLGVAGQGSPLSHTLAAAIGPPRAPGLCGRLLCPSARAPSHAPAAASLAQLHRSSTALLCTPGVDAAPLPRPRSCPSRAGRGIVTELRGKELVMRLMMHPDPDVQARPPVCVAAVRGSRPAARGGRQQCAHFRAGSRGWHSCGARRCPCSCPRLQPCWPAVGGAAQLNSCPAPPILPARVCSPRRSSACRRCC